MFFDKVLVPIAIVSTHARQLWAMLARKGSYCPEAWLKPQMLQPVKACHGIAQATDAKARTHATRAISAPMRAR